MPATMITQPELGKRLRAYRESKLLSLEAAGEKSVFPWQTIWTWEVGRATPRGGNLRRYCKALGIDPAELLRPQEEVAVG